MVWRSWLHPYWGLRRLRLGLGRTVEDERLPNKRLEGGRVDFFSLVDVDGAAHVSLETRVEETGWILQGRALGEGQLHDLLVGLARADDAIVGPHRRAHPLPLLDDVRNCFLDEPAHPAEGFSAPVSELVDSLRDEIRCRSTVARLRLLHAFILEAPGRLVGRSEIAHVFGKELAASYGSPIVDDRVARVSPTARLAASASIDSTT